MNKPQRKTNKELFNQYRAQVTELVALRFGVKVIDAHEIVNAHSAIPAAMFVEGKTAQQACEAIAAASPSDDTEQPIRIAKHTPGPWSYIVGTKAATISYYEFPLAMVESGGDHEELIANTKLISAAPDMLDGATLTANRLGALLQDYDLPEDVKGIIVGEIDALNELITKATGG